MKRYISLSNFVDFKLGSVGRKARLMLSDADAERLLPLGVIRAAEAPLSGSQQLATDGAAPGKQPAAAGAKASSGRKAASRVRQEAAKIQVEVPNARDHS